MAFTGGARLKLPRATPLGRMAAALAAFLLGVYGFAAAYAALRGSPGPLSDNAFRALQLIVGRFPDELSGRPLPWSLHVARWALPLLTFWSTIGLAWEQIRNPVRLRLTRARGDHVVVAGDEGLAARAAAAECARRSRVLLWTAEGRAHWVQDALDAGAAETAVDGDDMGAGALGLDRARAVLLLGADDAANVAFAVAAMDTAAAHRPAGDPLDVIVRVDDLDLRRSIEERFERADRSTARIRLASVPDILARQLFLTKPLDMFARVGEPERLLFAFGWTPTIERYVLRLLAAGHYRDGIKPRIVVSDPDAARQEAAFRARRPGADMLSPVLFETASIDQPALALTMLASLVERHGAPIAVLVDVGDDARALAMALALENAFRKAELIAPPIHVQMDARHDSQLGPAIHPFGGLDAIADPDLLLQERHDMLARSIHDFYLEGRLGEGDVIGSRASMHEWEDLAESFRDDNRLVADCYQLKLRDLGARVVEGAAGGLRLVPAELEDLSRAEHDRWMAAKLIDGWRYGPERDDRARVHPDIVPYDALSERIKDLDREQIRMMTRLLAKAGRTPRRLLTVALAPGGGRGLAAGVGAVLDALAEHYPDRAIAFLGALGDADSCDALTLAARQDTFVHLVVTEDLQDVLDALPAPARASARKLVRSADRIHAAAGMDPRSVLHDRADLRVATGDGGGSAVPTIRLTPAGAIAAAPWIR